MATLSDAVVATLSQSAEALALDLQEARTTLIASLTALSPDDPQTLESGIAFLLTMPALVDDIEGIAATFNVDSAAAIADMQAKVDEVHATQLLIEAAAVTVEAAETATMVSANAAAATALAVTEDRAAFNAGFNLTLLQPVDNLVPILSTADGKALPFFFNVETDEFQLNLDADSQRHAVGAVFNMEEIQPRDGWIPVFEASEGRAFPFFFNEDTGETDIIPSPALKTLVAPPLPFATGAFALSYQDGAIALIGDSIFARQEHTSPTDYVDGGAINASLLPPGLSTASQGWSIYKRLPLYARPEYHRADIAAVSEVGMWTTATNGAAGWDDIADREGWTRYSDSPNAAVSFVFGSTYDRTNIVYRKATAGTSEVTLSCTASQLEAWDGEEWVEANNFRFGMNYVVSGVGYGTTSWGARIRLRRAAGGSGNVTVTMMNTAGSGRFMWWGIERQVPGKTLTRFHLAARGGHRLTGGGTPVVGYCLHHYIFSDVIEHKPDVVFLELPLINIIAITSNIAEVIGEVQDYIWGDRPGFENTWALRKQLPATDVVVVIPNYARSRFTSLGAFADLGGGMTAERLYDAAAAYCASRGLTVLDVRPLFKEVAVASYSGNQYAALATGHYTTDGTHPNDAGAELYYNLFVSLFSY